jgi:hypothetical protein
MDCASALAFPKGMILCRAPRAFLLKLPQERILKTCREYDLPYITDATNFQPDLTIRNKLRNELQVQATRESKGSKIPKPPRSSQHISESEGDLLYRRVKQWEEYRTALDRNGVFTQLTPQLRLTKLPSGRDVKVCRHTPLRLDVISIVAMGGSLHVSRGAAVADHADSEICFAFSLGLSCSRGWQEAGEDRPTKGISLQGPVHAEPFHCRRSCSVDTDGNATRWPTLCARRAADPWDRKQIGLSSNTPSASQEIGRENSDGHH